MIDAAQYINTVRRVLIAEGWVLTDPRSLQTYAAAWLNVEGFTAEHTGPSCAVRHIFYRPSDPAASIAVEPVGGASDKNLGCLFDSVARLLRAGVIPVTAPQI